MAGKPEPHQHHIQHQPNVQNVVVYLSNENLAYAAVNQQNVDAAYQQQQNGGVGTQFAGAPQPVAALAPTTKTAKSPVKSEFHNNGYIGRPGSIALQQQAGFYAAGAGIQQSNNFHNCTGANVIGNIVYNAGGDGQAGTLFNQGFGTPLKTLVSQPQGDSVQNAGGEMCNGYSVSTQHTQALVQPRIAVSCTQNFQPGSEHKSEVVSAPLPVSAFVGGLVRLAGQWSFRGATRCAQRPQSRAAAV